ncbi:serine/threonine phosphatase [Acaryochloris sp. IP29b_bin.137]|uniref:serine/threonine phosphatase n=1 Tax=Acaryochloris sp. IP29b_bin.137 TaxID=2969217 RepID=UPI002621A327|nr:serine/threonine phosphatase [Acaryochloris sp. IP29b_bin.137]
MIKCPQCNYHNIDDHRFCQQCGTSLTQKSCANCGHFVDFDATHCPHCSHPTATIWRTILTTLDVGPAQSPTDGYSHSPERPSKTISSKPTDTFPVELSEEPSTEELLDTIDKLVNPPPGAPDPVEEVGQADPQIALLQTTETKGNLASAPAPIAPVIQRFLVQNPRYRLIEATSACPSPHPLQPGHHEFNLLDTQPLHVSPLAVMLDQLQGTTHPADMGKPGTITDFLAVQSQTFPVVLEPYLALRQQFPLLLPHIHDAWQSEQQSVIMLENRMGLPTLKQTIMGNTITSGQVLHWLQQTLNFVIASSPWNSSPSVLHIDNLRVDQGQILCLQKLIFEPEPVGSQGYTSGGENSPTQSSVWDDLRYVWLDLLQGLGAALATELHPLLTHLQTAGDVTPEELQVYLNDQHQQLKTAAAEDVQKPQILDLESGGAAPTLILPNKLVDLGSAGLTDDGRDRHHNEDYFVIEEQVNQCISPNQHHVSGRGLYILCDGMGGHAGGEVASSLAAETLRQYFQSHWQDDLPDAEILKEATYAANHALFQVNEEKAGSNRMGTTLVMALVQDTRIHIAHVGDSRLYRLTQQQGLEQITVDHEVGQREIQRGVAPEVAYARPDAYQLTQALGPRESEALVPDIQFLTVNEDTLFLICSDGLTDNQLLETYCDQHLLPMLNTQLSLQQGVTNLVALANEHNGHDNITAIAILMRVHPQAVSSAQ